MKIENLFLFVAVTLFKTVSCFTVIWRLHQHQTHHRAATIQPSGQQRLQGSLQDEDDYEFARLSRRRQRPTKEVYEQTEGIFDDDDEDYDEWDDDDDDDDYEDGEEYDLFSNVLIENPLLDQMDPDGAYERFPELASDPRFWFDMALFILFLNFLSGIGPQYYDALWFPDPDINPFS